MAVLQALDDVDISPSFEQKPAYFFSRRVYFVDNDALRAVASEQCITAGKPDGRLDPAVRLDDPGLLTRFQIIFGRPSIMAHQDFVTGERTQVSGSRRYADSPVVLR